MKTIWIYKAKTYTSRGAVLNLIRRILKDDKEILCAAPDELDKLTDDYLFDIGHRFYNISEEQVAEERTMKEGLKKFRVLTKFREAFKEDRRESKREKFDGDIVDIHLNRNWNSLGGAIEWVASPQGYDYWSDIYDKLNTYFEDGN